MPQRYAVRVVFDADAEHVARVVGRWATVTGTGNRAVLEMNVDSLEWPVYMLANIDADFTVESPPELVEAAARTAARFARSLPETG
jgi:hypothetical protein